MLDFQIQTLPHSPTLVTFLHCCLITHVSQSRFLLEILVIPSALRPCLASARYIQQTTPRLPDNRSLSGTS